MENAERTLSRGTIIAGRYRIDRVLGAGGMGTVYAAEDLKLAGSVWAVKMCPSRPFAAGPSVRDEAELLARLHHPMLPKLADYVPADDQGVSYLILELIKGETLKERFVRQGKRMPVRDAVRIACEVCDLFGYLHGMKPEPIVYRDLKPANIMIDERGGVRIIDLGIARSFKEGRGEDTVPVGSVGFASPEQLAGRQTDPRSDYFMLGALLYYLLSGGRYYYAEKRPIAQMGDDVPEGVADIVDKLLAEDPANRYADAMALKADLTEAMRSLMEREGGSSVSAGELAARRLIVVGAAYRGAGATFVAMGLSHALANRGVPHSLVEHPGNDGELWFWLSEAMGNERKRSRLAAPSDGWLRLRDKHRTWVGAWPSGLAEHAAGALTRELLMLKEPVAIVDISDGWDRPDVVDLLGAADHIAVVFGPRRARWGHPRIEGRLASLLRRENVCWIANRTTDGDGRLWAEFPARAAAKVPEIPVRDWPGWESTGRSRQPPAEIGRILVQALDPILRRWIPYNGLRQGRKPGRLGSWLYGNIWRKNKNIENRMDS